MSLNQEERQIMVGLVMSLTYVTHLSLDTFYSFSYMQAKLRSIFEIAKEKGKKKEANPARACPLSYIKKA